jgi:hypothetical protein
MKPLVTLFKRLRDPMAWTKAGREEATRQSDRRGAPRHEVDYAVWIKRRGLVPVAGTMINISRSGAAIRVHGWHVPVPGPWPIRLNHGDEVWLTDLLDQPLSCWVIAIEEGVMRVHFTLDEATRHELRQKYPILMMN